LLKPLRSDPLVELKRNRDGDWIIGVIAVIQVVPIAGVVKVHIVGFVPVLPPGFRPRINDCDPVSVVLEARLSAYENQRKSIDAEEVIAAEVEPEASLGNPIAVIAASLGPALVIAFPRTGARLSKAIAHLFRLLRNAAVVNAAVQWAVWPHTAVIGAAIAFLRSGMTLCRSGSLLRLRVLRGLRMLHLLRGLSVLSLRPGVRSVSAFSLLIVLGTGNSCRTEEQRQNCCTDYTGLFHLGKLL